MGKESTKWGDQNQMVENGSEMRELMMLKVAVLAFLACDPFTINPAILVFILLLKLLIIEV